MSTPDISSESSDIVVPDFREDERIQARYNAMLERRIKECFEEHENSIRRNSRDKSRELRAEVDAAQTEFERLKIASDAAREAYRAKYPHKVKKSRLGRPSAVDNVRGLGNAGKLYRAAVEAWRAAENAASEVRRVEHNREKLEAEMQKALERAPAISKDVTTSEKWLNEIHQDEDLAELKAKVEALLAERIAYTERVASGRVSVEELRLRCFAEQNIKRVQTPVNGAMFFRFEQFGNDAFFILRDTAKQLWALSYDKRLEPIIDGIYDFVSANNEIEVRRSTKEHSAIPMSLLDHFVSCSDRNDAAAQEAYGDYQRLLKQPRKFTTREAFDDTEAQIIERLARIAADKLR